MTASTKPVTVLVVDDHTLFRKGLVNLLRDRGLHVVGEAADGRAGIEQAVRLAPDVVLMDLNMPACNGIEATRAIHERLPEARILMLTVSEEDENLFAAIKAGAKGYLVKNIDPDELVTAIDRVMAGDAVIPHHLAAKLLTEFAAMANSRVISPSGDANGLTNREVEILRHLSTGAANKEIANALSISDHTVKIHLKNILQKLHLCNRTQAAIYAQRHGLVAAGPAGEAPH
ncbi:MAG: response regulator transcription factor [Nitrospiria bacterium]